MNATEKNIATLRAAEHLGYYAIARTARGDYGIIWASIRPVRRDSWTGESYPTQREAERAIDGLNSATPPEPPTGEIRPVN